MGLTLLTPWALLALPIAASLLVYAYRNRGKGTPRVVASLLLMRDLAKPRVSTQKFFPPPRFFVELLLILLLVLGLAGLASLQPKSKVVIVIDNSLSSMAKTQETSLTESLLELEKRDAEGVIRSYGEDTRFKVFEVAPVLKSRSNEWLSATEATRAVGEIESVWADDNLAQALTKLSSTEADTKLIAFTDIHLQRGSDDKSEVRSLIGEARAPCNLALSAISYIEGKVEVEVTSFCNKEVIAKVAIEQLAAENDQTLTPATVRWIELESKKVRFTADQTVSVSFATTSRDGRAYKVQLSGDAGTDVLTADDTAWITVVANRNELTIVSPLGANQLGLSGVRNTTFNYITPAEIEREGIAAFDRFPNQPVLFHRVVPTTLPDRDLLFFAPPDDNQLLGTKSVVEDAPLLRWETTNPLLAYLNLEGINLPRATLLDVPPWAHSVASVADGSILYEGEIAGKRRVVAGFELLPFEGGKRPLLSIFFLNLMRSIATVQGDVGFNRVPMVLERSKTVRTATYVDAYLDNGEKALPEVLKSEGGESLILPAPGLVQSEPDRTLYALNFISPGEGNFMQTRSAKVFAAETSTKSAARAYSDYAWWCAWAALTILLLDLLAPYLLIFVKRRFSSPAPASREVR